MKSGRGQEILVCNSKDTTKYVLYVTCCARGFAEKAKKLFGVFRRGQRVNGAKRV